MRRAARLRRTHDLALVRKEGRSLRRDAFSARARRTDVAVVRLAVVAPAAIGRSVARNRARRRVREAFRVATAQRRDTSGLDVIVSVRKEALAADFVALRDAAADVLAEAAR